ncbi:MAG: branched-chain amino acid ABC transporter substrate-binding protein [Chloroflexota bacterium]
MFVCLLAFVVLLTACTGGAPVVPPTQPPAATSAAKPVATSAPSPTVAPTTPPTAPPAPKPTVVVPSSSPPASPVASPSPNPVTGVLVPPTPTIAPASQLIGPIKIVSSLPRAGNTKNATDSMVMAIKMALDEIGGRLEGASVVYEDWDDASPSTSAWDKDKEAENANRAVNDPDVMVYIGPLSSNAARVSIPILNQANLGMVSPSASYVGLTRGGAGAGAPNEPNVYYPSGKRNFVRVVPADDVQGAMAAQWAKQLGASRVYVLDDADPYGKAIAASFAETASKLGLQVAAGPESVNPRARDFTGIAAKIRDTGNVELVYYAGLTDDNGGLLFKELRRTLGPNVRLMGADGLYQQGFLDEAGDGAEGALLTFGTVAPSKLTGRGAEWYRSYRVRFNAEPDTYAPYAYEAIKVALDAIKRAGKKDRALIRDALLATRDYDGILGRFSFDANGDTTLTTISGREVKNGKFDDTNAVTLQAQ